MTGSKHKDMVHGALGVSNATTHTTDLSRSLEPLCMQDRQHACIHGNSSRETLPCDHRKRQRGIAGLPQEGMMGNPHHVAETATVAIAGDAAAACAACAAAAAVKMTLQYAGVHSDAC